jgi:hypothetical protein
VFLNFQNSVRANGLGFLLFSGCCAIFSHQFFTPNCSSVATLKCICCHDGMEALREGRRRGNKEEEMEENVNGEGENKEEEMGEKEKE